MDWLHKLRVNTHWASIINKHQNIKYFKVALFTLEMALSSNESLLIAKTTNTANSWIQSIEIAKQLWWSFWNAEYLFAVKLLDCYLV